MQYRIRVPCIGTASHTKVYCVWIESVHATVYYFTILCST